MWVFPCHSFVRPRLLTDPIRDVLQKVVVDVIRPVVHVVPVVNSDGDAFLRVEWNKQVFCVADRCGKSDPRVATNNAYCSPNSTIQ